MHFSTSKEMPSGNGGQVRLSKPRQAGLRSELEVAFVPIYSMAMAFYCTAILAQHTPRAVEAVSGLVGAQLDAIWRADRQPKPS